MWVIVESYEQTIVGDGDLLWIIVDGTIFYGYGSIMTSPTIILRQK